jgi:hypothetical protein
MEHPVFAHPGRCAHLVGVHKQRVPVHTYIPGASAIPPTAWAPGYGPDDHGCSDCRNVAEAAYEAAERVRQLEQARPAALSRGRPSPPTAPKAPTPPIQAEKECDGAVGSIYLVAICAIPTGLLLWPVFDTGFLRGMAISAALWMLPFLSTLSSWHKRSKELRAARAAFDSSWQEYVAALARHTVALEFHQEAVRAHERHTAALLADTTYFQRRDPDYQRLAAQVAEHDRRQKAAGRTRPPSWAKVAPTPIQWPGTRWFKGPIPS